MKTYNFGGKIVEAIGVSYEKGMNACKGCAFFVDGVATCASYKMRDNEELTPCDVCQSLDKDGVDVQVTNLKK